MKTFGLTVTAAAIMSATAWAGGHATDLKTLIIDNTYVVAGAEGTIRVDFAEDGTYTSDAGISGTWTLEGQTVCVTRSTGESSCNDVPEDVTVGSSWPSTNALGQDVTLTIE